MRYFAGLIGGLVVAVLLLVFQNTLIGAERHYRPQPAADVTLDRVFESRPPEQKPYEPRSAPPEPEVVKPDLPTDPPATRNPRPQPVDFPTIGIDGIHGGAGPKIFYGGGGFTDGAVVATTRVRPVYPPAAVRQGIEGEVEVEFTVLPDGSVADVSVVRAEPRGIFEQSAQRAIQRWGFVPKRENGQPVATRVRQVIRFELPNP